MRPKILLTNDDGVNSEGIWAAYEALSEFADVTVVAPSTQQSAVGRSTSIFDIESMVYWLSKDVKNCCVKKSPSPFRAFTYGI